MKLKAVIEKLEDVDEKFRDLYTKRQDGKYVLDTDHEDVSSLKATLEKERATREEYEKKMKLLKDVDPEEYRRLKEQEQQMKDKKLLDEGKVEELLTERTGRMKTQYEKEKGDLSTQIQSLQNQLYELRVETEVLTAASKAGAHEKGIDDIKRRAKDVFTVNEKGEIVAKGADGKPLFGSDGKPLSPSAWMQDLPTEAPHLFRGNAGGGANNGGANGGTPGGQLYRSEMTAQQKSEYIGKHGNDKYQELPMSRPKA